MSNSTLDSLLKKAKESEQKYEWLQATKLYKKATDLASKEKDLSKVSELQEHTAFCFYRAAFQVQTNNEFEKYIKKAVQVYQTELELLKDTSLENKYTRIKHANALVEYTKSWLEKKPLKKKKLLKKWWTLENLTLSKYESEKDLYRIGKICNDLMEYSYYHRINLVNSRLENEKIIKEMINLASKAIQAFSKLDNDYELARAYCFSSIYNNMAQGFLWSEAESQQSEQRNLQYSKKALELSKKTRNEWLISWSYISLWISESTISAFSKTSLDYGKKIKDFGVSTKDKFLIAKGKTIISLCTILMIITSEDPDEVKKSLRKSKILAEEAINDFQTINHLSDLAYYSYLAALRLLSGIETNPKTRQQFFEMASKVIKEGMELFQGWKKLLPTLFNASAEFYGWHLSRAQSKLEEKKEMLRKGIDFRKKYIEYKTKMNTLGDNIYAYLQLGNLESILAKIETDANEKSTLLKSAVKSMEKCIEFVEKKRKIKQGKWWKGNLFAWSYSQFGNILAQVYKFTKENKVLIRATKTYEMAIDILKKVDLPVHIAEDYWHLAQLFDLQGDQQKSSQNYEDAAESYIRASKKIPQIKTFYENYSAYMSAWSQIEKGRYCHSIENYENAKEHYEKAAHLHESSEFWSYLSPNYFAWASLEEAENLSRKENTHQAIQKFQKTFELFSAADDSLKQKLEDITILENIEVKGKEVEDLFAHHQKEEKNIKTKITENITAEERDLIIGLLESSDLRRRYCQARILLEKAKLLDKEGKYLKSSKHYGEAAQTISSFLVKINVEVERKELEYLAILCQAWEKMAIAEEISSSESYIDAATLFERAKDYCFTKKASLWALGNINFCKGLAAGIEYQRNMNLEKHSKAKGYIRSASSNYSRAGFKNASEYAKATQRLFDAYFYMNQAETESDQETRAKQYQLAENLLQIAAGSFMKAKQPEKTTQIQEILVNVREEKALAMSLSQVMHAPLITSSTSSFTAPTPTNENSVGLESFQSANVQASLVATVNEVRIGESFSLSVEIVNAGREPALLMQVEDFISPNFVVVKKPEIYRIEDTCLNMKGRQIAPLKLVEAKLVFQASNKGIYRIQPRVKYLDEAGQNKFIQLKSIEIKVQEVILEDRILTGTKELDSLLLGGIPNEYAVALTGIPSDERDLLIRNFLKAGTNQNQPTFYVSTEADDLDDLLKNPSFYLFLCNPKPKTAVPDLPNVYKLASKTDLTNLAISLTRAFRKINQSRKKRICLEIISDVLVDYKVQVTRKWIAETITNYCSKGFTMLAVIDPTMHTNEQVGAVLNLYNGEISINQTKDSLECKTSIRIEKLRNQDYVKNPICLLRSF